jgi:hypothetical protein
MNNLEKLKKATAKKIKYLVKFNEITYYQQEVEAINEDEAIDIARDEIENGNGDSTGSDLNYQEIEEL